MKGINPYWVFMALSALGISLIGSGIVRIVENGTKLIYVGLFFLFLAVLWKIKLYKLIR